MKPSATGGENRRRMRVFGAVWRGHCMVDVRMRADDVIFRGGDGGGGSGGGGSDGDGTNVVDCYGRDAVLDGVQAAHDARRSQPGLRVIVPAVLDGCGYRCHALQSR